jgi:hypothetical protein
VGGGRARHASADDHHVIGVIVAVARTHLLSPVLAPVSNDHGFGRPVAGWLESGCLMTHRLWCLTEGRQERMT